MTRKPPDFMPSPRCRPALRAAVFLLLSSLPAAVRPASAQAPAASDPGGAAGGPGSGAPAGNGPAPGVASGVPKPNPGRPLTLGEVVALAVGGNSGLVIAQQRLQKAQELIVQVNAQGRPQFSADGVDTYSSYRAFAPVVTTPTITSPALPGGGQIPQIVDAATSFSTGFIGGGGGGNAPSSGGVSSVGLSAAPAGGGAGPGASPGSSGSGAVGPTGVGTSGVTTPGSSAPGSQSPSAGGPPGPAPAQAAPGNAAPGGAAPGGAAPGGAAPGGAAPAAGGTAAPSSGAPGTAAPGAAAPGGAAAPAGGVGTGSAGFVPAILADYAGGDAPAALAAPQAADARPEQAGGAAPAASRDTTTGTGTGSGTGTTSTVAPGGAATTGQRNGYAGRISATQYLDLFGLLSAARGAQADVRDFYSLDIERLRNEIALAAKDLFFNLLLTQSQVATQEEQVRYAAENVRITQERLRQGIVSRFDVLTAQTALSTAQQQLISAQDSRDLAQANLSYLLGTDPERPLALQTPPLPPLTLGIDLRQSTQAALIRRPEVRQAGRNVEEAQRLVRLAGSSLLPTVGLVVNGERTSIASITSPKSYATISAEVAVPLDDGGATRSRVRSARVDVQTQVLTLAELKLSVSLEVRQATLNIRNAQAQVGAARTGVTQAQEALRLAYLRYQGGLGTFLDVLNALAQLASTRNNLSSAEFFYQVSLAQLARAVGSR